MGKQVLRVVLIYTYIVMAMNAGIMLATDEIRLFLIYAAVSLVSGLVADLLKSKEKTEDKEIND